MTVQLRIGQKLGPFEIAAALGEGGMGEVFRAVDTRLGRSVAIKILPARLAADPTFRARFEREARLISSLNHPHICSLYDIRLDNGIDYLVMELLEGQTLADRLVQAPMPVREVLRCGAQIASALAAAHRKGVVHRDLKPGNIVVGKSGPKLLDFGLAKAEPHVAAAAANATATMPLTSEHTIVGTLQYMAPEQLEGRDADARTDIFAFGAVLYEMVTGRKAFDGKSKASLIGAIMTAEPPSAVAIQPVTPAALDRIIRQCLAKDPDARWQDAGDLEKELEWLVESGSQTGMQAAAAPRKRVREYLGWAAAAAAAVIACVLAVALYRTPHTEPQVARFTLPEPPDTTSARMIPAVSPDGTKVLVVARKERTLGLWVHDLSSGEITAVPGTERAYGGLWGADSHAITFPRQGLLCLRDLHSGAERDITPEPGLPSTGAFGENLVLFCISGKGLWSRRLDDPAAPVRQVTQQDPAAGDYILPAILPGERYALVTGSVRSGSGLPVFRIDLATGARQALPIASSGQVAYSPTGHILYVNREFLVAQKFDPRNAKLQGAAVPLAGPIQGVAGTAALRAFSISRNGVLAFRRAGLEQSRLTWYSRSGEVSLTVGEPGDYSNPVLSRDGSRLAVGLRDPFTRTRDIWMFDVARGARARLTNDPSDDLNPALSADGERYLYTSDRDGTRSVFLASVRGGRESKVSGDGASVEDWSVDGRFATFSRVNNGIWAVPIEGQERKPFLVEDKAGAKQSRFSPDGKWLAFVAEESGGSQIFVDAFPPTAWKVRISPGGGTEPQWRGDGKELYYMRGNRLMAVPISTADGKFAAGTPVPLFEVPVQPLVLRNRYVPGSDGKRFLFLVPVPEEKSPPVTVIVNWPGMLNLRGAR